MIRGVIQFADLQDLCKPGKRPKCATVEQWAREQGIAFKHDAEGGIWTTQDALNIALGIKAANDGDQAPYGPEDV